jgi:hypothetical protein
MVILHNGNKIIDADIGSSVSKDPYFKFKVAGVKGDTIELKYKDKPVLPLLSLYLSSIVSPLTPATLNLKYGSLDTELPISASIILLPLCNKVCQ